MKRTKLFTAGLIATALIPTLALAENNSNVTQKQEVEKIVHDYLISHPEVLLEASQALQQKQQQEMQQQAQGAIKENASQLFHDSLAAVGNPKGTVTLVEFFDYQCGHCQKMGPVMSELIKKNKHLKVVYKEFPIFGKSSETASRAALAAGMQGKYHAMHDALLKADKRLDDTMIMDMAKNLGLNMTKLKADMDSKTVTDALSANRQLAEKLHLMGTPAFIVVSTPVSGSLKADNAPAFIPGAASEASLQELIKKASGSNQEKHDNT